MRFCFPSGETRLLPLTTTPGFDLLLSANTLDFDRTGESFTYVWSCHELVSQSSCWDAETQSYYFSNSSTIVVPSYELGIGVYEFSVTVYTPLGLPTTATQLVFTNGVGPMITVQVGLTFLHFIREAIN